MSKILMDLVSPLLRYRGEPGEVTDLVVNYPHPGATGALAVEPYQGVTGALDARSALLVTRNEARERIGLRPLPPEEVNLDPHNSSTDNLVLYGEFIGDYTKGDGIEGIQVLLSASETCSVVVQQGAYYEDLVTTQSHICAPFNAINFYDVITHPYFRVVAKNLGHQATSHFELKTILFPAHKAASTPAAPPASQVAECPYCGTPNSEANCPKCGAPQKRPEVLAAPDQPDPKTITTWKDGEFDQRLHYRFEFATSTEEVVIDLFDPEVRKMAAQSTRLSDVLIDLIAKEMNRPASVVRRWRNLVDWKPGGQ
jgi:hypothetical protein